MSITITRLLLPVLLLLSLVVAPLRVAAQSSPPDSVIGAARAMIVLMGIPLPEEQPIRVGREIGKNTNHICWSILWPGLSVTVDESTLEVISFNHSERFQGMLAKFKQGQERTVSETQATNLINALRQTLNINTSDWRIQRLESRRQPTGFSYWAFVVRRYAYDRPVELGYLIGSIDPYEPKVVNWQLSKSATLLLPQGPLLTKEQARVLAVNTFSQWAAPLLNASDSREPVASGSGVWESLHDATTLSRLTYRFIFRITPILSGMEEPIYTRPPYEIWVDIDGETGETLSVASVLASGGKPKNGGVKLSPRQKLQSEVGHKIPEPLFVAICGGKPVTPDTRKPAFKAKDASLRRFEFKTNGRTISFALDRKNRTLWWQDTTGEWQGLLLRQEYVESLERWLKGKN